MLLRESYYANRIKHKRVTIYTLTNPENQKVFYVGRTTLSLPARLSCHISQKKGIGAEIGRFLADLKQRNIRPSIKAIDECDYKDRKRVEEYWIHQLETWGYDLVNTRQNKNKGYYAPHERIKKHSRFTDEEMLLRDALYQYGDHEKIAQALSCSSELIRHYYKRKTIPMWIREGVVSYYRQKARSARSIIDNALRA